MGSDWYMIEMEKFKGVGLYFHQMFLMLKEVSKSVMYDAWHQFAVVNPLRFLGLIPDAKGVKGPYALDVNLLDKYGKLFEPFLTDAKWKDRANFTGNVADVQAKRSSTFDAFSLNASIADSADIKENGTLLILK